MIGRYEMVSQESFPQGNDNSGLRLCGDNRQGCREPDIHQLDDDDSTILINSSTFTPSSSDPHHHSLTSLTTFITIVKCAVGGGSFSLPYAFQLGGVYASFLFTLFLGYLCFHTIDLLIYCEKKFIGISRRESPHLHYSHLSYSQMGSLAFPHLKVSVRGWEGLIEFHPLSVLINLGIFSTCVGVCVAYIDLIASVYPSLLSNSAASYSLANHSQTLEDPFPSPSASPSSPSPHISQYHYLSPSSPLAHWLLLPLLIPLSLISNYRYLVTTSTLGSIAVYLGLLLVLLNGIHCSSSSGRVSLSQPFLQTQSFPQYISRTCFLFAIHIVILPIAQAMTPPSYLSFRRVLFLSYSTISLSNALFGAIVYLLYSSLTCSLPGPQLFSHGPCPNILDSLSDGVLISTVKALICIDLLFSIPLILSSARELLIDTVLLLPSTAPPPSPSSPSPSRSTVSLVIRVFLPFLLLLLSSSIPDFGVVIDLVGGVCNSLMGFVLPPLFVLALHHRERWRSLPLSCQQGTLRWHLYVAWNVAIIAFGLYLMALTTHGAIHAF
jgi:amino acid permease